jgi:hypothetical protein
MEDPEMGWQGGFKGGRDAEKPPPLIRQLREDFEMLVATLPTSLPRALDSAAFVVLLRSLPSFPLHSTAGAVNGHRRGSPFRQRWPRARNGPSEGGLIG